MRVSNNILPKNIGRSVKAGVLSIPMLFTALPMPALALMKDTAKFSGEPAKKMALSLGDSIGKNAKDLNSELVQYVPRRRPWHPAPPPPPPPPHRIYVEPPVIVPVPYPVYREHDPICSFLHDIQRLNKIVDMSTALGEELSGKAVLVNETPMAYVYKMLDKSMFSDAPKISDVTMAMFKPIGFNNGNNVYKLNYFMAQDFTTDGVPCNVSKVRFIGGPNNLTLRNVSYSKNNWDCTIVQCYDEATGYGVSKVIQRNQYNGNALVSFSEINAFNNSKFGDITYDRFLNRIRGMFAENCYNEVQDWSLVGY